MPDHPFPFTHDSFYYTTATPTNLFPLLSYIHPIDAIPSLNFLDHSPTATLSINKSTTTTTFSNPHGYSSVRSNLNILSGTFSFSTTLTSGHARIGFSTREFNLNTPCGFCLFSFSLSTKNGCIYHNNQKLKFTEHAFTTGDVITCTLHVPTNRQSDLNLFSRHRIPIKYKQNTFFEVKDYQQSKTKHVLQESFIEYAVNGKSMGVAFRGLRYPYALVSPEEVEQELRQLNESMQGSKHCNYSKKMNDGWQGYYATVSVYEGECNVEFGDEWKERGIERVAQEVVQDCIEEVLLWFAMESNESEK